MEEGHHPDLLEEVIDGYDSIEEHEEALGDVQDIFQVSLGLGLEVLDAIVSHIANSSSGQRRQSQRGDVGDAVLRQLGFKVGQRVGFQAMLGARDEGLAWVCADEAIASDAFVGRCRLEEEGKLGVGAGWMSAGHVSWAAVVS